MINIIYKNYNLKDFIKERENLEELLQKYNNYLYSKDCKNKDIIQYYIKEIKKNLKYINKKIKDLNND